jgi:hypothetical protein
VRLSIFWSRSISEAKVGLIGYGRDDGGLSSREVSHTCHVSMFYIDIT